MKDVKAGYDKMNAHDLFVKFGLSKRLVDDFITPTLLVGLFKPPEELSALVVMELLYYYALAHQDSFDVRWIKVREARNNVYQYPLDANISTERDCGIVDNCAHGKTFTR